MSKIVIIAAGLSLLGAVTAQAAPVKSYPMAKDGTTNIADCAKADVSVRNECISRARPVMGKQIYAQMAADKAAQAKKDADEAAKAKAAKIGADKAAAKLAKVKAPIPAAVVGAPKGFKIDKDGTTNIADCAKANPAARDQCISRSRPLTNKELMKFEKRSATSIPAQPKTAAATNPLPRNDVIVPAPKAIVKVQGKGFTVAKDGTTDIADCAKANPEFRNECISRSRPVSGKALYASFKSKS